MLQSKGDMNNAAEALQKILYNTNIGEEMKKKHEEIVQAAKKFAESAYDMLRKGELPDFMQEYMQQQMMGMQAMMGNSGHGGHGLWHLMKLT